MGTPLSDVVSRVCAKSPKATVTRYDDVLLSRCHSLTVWPSSSSRLVITPLAMPVHGAGTRNVKS
jgi:hypothetical protein